MQRCGAPGCPKVQIEPSPPDATLARGRRLGAVPEGSSALTLPMCAAQYGSIEDSPAQQYNAIFGGNANLKPETSDSFTLGLVLTPMANLSFTVDAFDMKVEDVIGGLPASTTLAQCLDSGDPTF